MSRYTTLANSATAGTTPTITTKIMTKQPKSWRDVIKVHPAADMFPRLPPDELKALGKDIKNSGLQIPLVLWNEKNMLSQLLDGVSRLDAMEAVGLPTVNREGNWLHPDIRYTIEHGDPHAFVCSVNIHRRHLSCEEKRDWIAKLIKATPTKSDRQIAEQIKASPSTIGKVRKELERAGDVSNLDTRIDSKGRQQPAHKTVATNVEDFPDNIISRLAPAMPIDTMVPVASANTIEPAVTIDEESEADARELVLLLETFKNNLLSRVKAWVEMHSGVGRGTALYDILDEIHCETATLTLAMLLDRTAQGEPS